MHYYLNIHTKQSQWELPTQPALEVSTYLILQENSLLNRN